MLGVYFGDRKIGEVSLKFLIPLKAISVADSQQVVLNDKNVILRETFLSEEVTKENIKVLGKNKAWEKLYMEFISNIERLKNVG